MNPSEVRSAEIKCGATAPVLGGGALICALIYKHHHHTTSARAVDVQTISAPVGGKNDYHRCS
jgi:hypothetical protein